jgi:hypothetical protein
VIGHEKWLRQAADEIRKEGHAGWGNICEQAADRIAELGVEVDQYQRILIAEGDKVARLEAENQRLSDEVARLRRMYVDWETD